MDPSWYQNDIQSGAYHENVGNQKAIKNQRKFNEFTSSRGAKIDKTSIKNRLNIEAQVGVPFGIDFSSILGGFGSQVGQENRAKINQKFIQKGIEKRMQKKKCVLEASWKRFWPSRETWLGNGTGSALLFICGCTLRISAVCFRTGEL